MPKRIAWNRRLNAKLGGVTLALLVVSVALISANIYMLQDIKEDAAQVRQVGRGREHAYEYLYWAHRLFAETGAARGEVASSIQRVIADTDDRLRAQLGGDAASGIAKVEDPELVASLQKRQRSWNAQVKPVLLRLLAAGSAEEAEPLLQNLRQAVRTRTAALDEAVDVAERASTRKVDQFQLLQYAFVAVVAIVLGLVIRIAQSVGTRTRALAVTAEKIAAGDLKLAAPVSGTDEIALLGGSFNAMTSKLRELLEAEQEGRRQLEQLLDGIAQVTHALASGTSEILAGTTQQASGAQEQATAVSETVTTVDEVTQTADQAAQRARAVAEASQRSLDISKAGRKAVDDTVAGMGHLKEQVEEIAESIVALAEQAQAIGDIIATVNEIAEQTNLLALNAGIEASRAGELGKGFSVVATEVKALADQAKKATAQVRQILGDIQKATNGAVLSTEEGVKSVGTTTKLVTQAGETIRALSETITEAAQSAAQIAASAGQQAAGMAQIHQAMRQVDQATHQNLASTKQQERAAQDLNALGLRLKELTSGFGR